MAIVQEEAVVNDDVFLAIKAKIDEKLAAAAPNAGIAMGSDLYSEFKERSLLTMEKFIWLGFSDSQLFADRVPAYRRTHFVHEDFDLCATGFHVGRRET